MSKPDNIPAPAVRRLSLYLRHLETLQPTDRQTVSSRQLGDALNLSDAQVRKDLAYFGQFGHPGVGYRVTELIHRVRRILGTDRTSDVLLVGVGNLGRALLSFHGFREKGFRLVAAFDNDPRKIGTAVSGTDGIRVQPTAAMPDVVHTHGIRLGIMAVPATAAQAVADEMVVAGVKGILNFAPVRINVARGVSVSTVDLAVHLEQLSFQFSGCTT